MRCSHGLSLHEYRAAFLDGLLARDSARARKAVGLPVRSLRRISFGPLKLARLAEGRHRRLTPAEIEALREAAGGEAR